MAVPDMNVATLPEVPRTAPQVPGFLHDHIVTFEETNLVGNVYYTNYVRWQGTCRELFLIEHAPEILSDLATQRLLLHTSSVSCEFLSDRGLSAGERVRIQMRLKELRGGRLTLQFEYYRLPVDGAAELVARGEQALCSKHRAANGSVVACVLPAPLLRALLPFSPNAAVRARIEEGLAFLVEAGGQT